MNAARILYSVADAAIQLSVSQRTMESLIRDGQIDTVKIGRRRLVPDAALRDYVDRIKAAS